MGTYAADLQTMSVGLLLVRVVVGLIMAGHGAQKLFGWFGGYGVRKTGEFFAQLGFQPGTAFAAAASISEIVSGLLVTFGFLGPVGPALMIAVMIVAAITVHWGHGLFAQNNGIELPLLYTAAAFGLASRLEIDEIVHQDDEGIVACEVLRVDYFDGCMSFADESW